MSDWLWPAVTVVLVVLLALTWMRSRERTASDDGAKADSKPEPETDPEAEEKKPKKKKKEAAKAAVESHPEPDIRPSKADLPKLEYEDDDEVDPTKIGAAAVAKRPKVQPPTKRIVYDEDAAREEPTQASAMILVTAQAQTDKGLRRKRNEDSILALPDHGVFVVADGMGGYQGGEIASALAVKTIEHAFRNEDFAAEPHDNIPVRGSELARAIQMANDAILDRAQEDKNLAGMGTTICAVRFAPQKERLYVGHVGDSRLYRIRDGELRRMTSDHTMKDFGVTGPQAAHLSRAVGVWPTVAIDVVLGKPRAGDLYILCSDGLTKMVKDDEIRRVAAPEKSPSEIVEDLVGTANANGGKDNISVIVIRVLDATVAAKDAAKDAARAP